MLTIKLKIDKTKLNTDDDSLFIENKEYEYSCAFFYFYSNFNKVKFNLESVTFFRKRFNLSEIEYRSLKSEVETFIKIRKTDNDKKLKRLEKVKKEVNTLLTKTKLTKKEKRTLFKLKRTIRNINNSLKKDVTFGGKDNLRKISSFSNKLLKLNKDISLCLDEKQKEELISEYNETKNSLDIVRKSYKDNRLRCLYVMGEANQKSNRFFDFSELTNHIIYYKPNKKVKIPISFYSNKLTDVNLKKLEELSKSNILPITVYLSTESVSLSFDEDILNNYNLGDNSLQTNKTDRKVILDKIQENKNNKTILLKKERTLGIDLNPQYIGCSVIEKIEGNNDEVKIIYKFCFDLSKFISKLPRKYSKEKRTYHNNKHKYEITQIIKQIVKIAKHYRCYSVSMEDLNFSVGDSGKGVYFNRITKNIWHREVIEQALSKQTNIHSLELRKVNPVYTSLIGNIKNNSFDPVNASIEIGRRGLLGFKKENIYICKYPTVDETVHTAVQSILKRNGDDSYEKRNISTWKGISTILKKYRYRWVLEEVKFSKMRMNTRKSKINKYIFE